MNIPIDKSDYTIKFLNAIEALTRIRSRWEFETTGHSYVIWRHGEYFEVEDCGHPHGNFGGFELLEWMAGNDPIVAKILADPRSI